MTEPAGPEELIDRAHVAVDWAAAFKASLPEPGAAAGHISFRARSVLRQLADAGFLADPEQGSELERLRDEVRTLRELNVGWVAYRDRKSAERKRHVEEFEDALGPEHAGGGYWYERMIAAARKVRAERDQLAWLHAEEAWLHGQALAIAESNAREWHQLRTRIDRALAQMRRWWNEGEPRTGLAFEAVEAELKSNLPAPVLPGDETPQPEEDQ